MGSKGGQTTTTNTNQSQTYNPAGGGYLQSALDKAGAAASQPFNIPQAPVAGFSQDQLSAFNAVNNAQGMAQPYINQAQQYFTPQGAQQFLNPYAQNVMSGLQDVFGQQQAQTTGQLTQAAGGVGADRIGVGQANLAKEQGLAAGQTLSGLYSNAVQQAQSAGYGQAALGSQAQNAALSGAQAQLATGGLQQQLQQAQLNAPYQQQLAQSAFPYQQAQFLAGITGSLAPGLGGTTSGTGTSATTSPAPSIWSQLLGAGTAAAGLYGQSGGFGSKGSGNAAYGGNGVYGGSSANPLPGLSPSDYGEGYAGGGEVSDDPIDVSKQSIIPTVQSQPIQAHIPQLNLSAPPPATAASKDPSAGDVIKDVGKIAMMFANRGGRTPYDRGGVVGSTPGMGFAEGGDVPSPYSVAPMLDVAQGVVPLAGAPATAAPAAPTRGARFPEGYYDKVPLDMRLSRTGVSHPGYRWEVYDPRTGAVMRKDLQTSSGANLARDRLDNKYGGYRYQTRPVQAKELQEQESKWLQDNGISLGGEAMARGGRAFADGGEVDDARARIQDMIVRNEATRDRTDGGVWRGNEIETGATRAANIADDLRGRPRRMFANGYAQGGAPDDDVINPDEPFRMPGQAAMDDWRRSADTAMAFSGDTPAASVAFPVAARRGAGAPIALSQPEAELPANPYSVPVQDPEDPNPPVTGDSFTKSPWAALTAAGLGIMGGTSPFAGVNIGQGGMQGLKSLEAQRAASQKDETIAQAAKRLAQEAKFHEDQFNRETVGQRAAREQADRPYSQLTRAQQETTDLARRKQELEEMKPVQVGQDDYGRPIMARRNPKSGEYEIINRTTPPAPEAPAAPVAPGVSGTPPATVPPATTNAAVDPAALPVNATATQGLLPSGTFKNEPPPSDVNAAALEGMKPSDANKVKAIAEGRAQFLPLTRNNAYNRYIMDKVSEYDPAVDQTAYSRRSRTANFFAVGTQGGGGQNIASMNTFGQHADELMRLAKDLDLGQYPTWNAVKNALAAKGLSNKEIQDKLGAWEVAQKAVGDEGAKVFAGSNSALADREAWNHMFDPANPRSVTESKLKEVVKLISGRLNSLKNQYNEGMRTSHEAGEFIVPKTREIFANIMNGKTTEGAPENKTVPAAAPPAAAPAAAAPAPVEKAKTITQNGFTYTLQPDGSYQ